jgi:hypothetical protein
MGAETANCSRIDAAKELCNSKIDMVRTEQINAPINLRVELDAVKTAEANPTG